MNLVSKLTCWGIILAGFFMVACTGSTHLRADYQIVPMPLELEIQSGAFFLKNGAVICYTAGNDRMRKNAELLASYIEE